MSPDNVGQLAEVVSSRFMALGRRRPLQVADMPAIAAGEKCDSHLPIYTRLARNVNTMSFRESTTIFPP